MIFMVILELTVRFINILRNFKKIPLMKRLIFPTLFLMLITSFLIQCKDDFTLIPEPGYEEIVAVANKAAGSVSFINSQNNELIKTLSIPNSEPMYVVYVAKNDRLYVGDRAGKKIDVINPASKTVETSIPVGTGVFHMWAGGNGSQLWVNNDIDNTISVINISTNTVVKTIDVGMKPHDVFVTQDGSKAFVSVFSPDPATPDKIFMYSTSNFNKTAEMNVGKDPHLYHIPSTNKLYVPCQSGELFVLDGNNLNLLEEKSFPGAHGIFPSPDNQYLFVTNLPGSQIYTIKTSDYSQLGMPTSTTTAVPHNVVVNEMGNKLFVTHSGATADKVSIYAINNGLLSLQSIITTATNPFGIAYYKREIK